MRKRWVEAARLETVFDLFDLLWRGHGNAFGRHVGPCVSAWPRLDMLR